MRTPLPAVAAVIAFIEQPTGIDGLLELMTDDHVLAVPDEP